MIATLIAPLLLGALQAPQIGPNKIRALFVGVGSYSNGEMRAMRGDLDAQRMAHLFRFQLGVPAENVKVLDQDKDLSKQRILEEIDNWLIGKAGKDDALVFYWSGNASSFTQKDGNMLNAVIPLDYAVTPDGKSVVSSSLIFTNELKQRFSTAKRERGLKDLLWLMDSTYSVDSIGGEDRYSCLFQSELDGATNADVDTKNLDNVLIVNAGSDSKLLSQIELPTGPNGEREPISPLAFAFQKLGNRLTNYMSYGELEAELRAVALENREDRQPRLDATLLERERTLFGGHATTRRNYYAVGMVQNKRSPFEVTPGSKLDLEPGMPTIPVGQLAGIEPGMRFLISGPKTKAREFRVVRVFPQVAQLSSGGPTTAGEFTDAKATLVDGVGVSKFEIFIGEDSGLNAFNRGLLKEKLAANPYIDVLATKPKAGKELVGTREGFQIAGTDFPYMASHDPQLTVDAAYNYIWHHARGEFVSSIESQGAALFKVEAEACPLNVREAPLATEIFSHFKPAAILSPNDTFAVRVRVSNNRNSLTALLNGVTLPSPKNFYVHVLKIDAHGAVAKVCEPVVISANLIERGAWNYVGIQSQGVNKGLVNYQRAREAPDEVAPFKVGESSLGKSALTLKLVVTDSAEDLCGLTSGNAGSSGALSDFGRILDALGRESSLPATRGKGKAVQDWGVATLRFVAESR